MDNLIFEKIWIDSNPFEDLFQIKVTASNERITMFSEVYAQTKSIAGLQKEIENLLLKPFEIVWGNNDDDSDSDCVRFSVTANKRGRATITVFMKTHTFEDKNDTASFAISTDISSLDRFSSELKQIADGEIGVKVQLHDPA